MYEDGGFNQKRLAPVNEGDEIDVRIESVGEKGDGVAKIKGFVIFVPGVKEGEKIKIKIKKVLKSVGFGEKVGEAEGPIEEEKPQHEEVNAEELPDADNLYEEDAVEDTEDFGEEPEDESSEPQEELKEPEEAE
ncbi:TRAM domain-containing protein [Candidatus Woesearchaeota archaeon]|jgi:predicted RNA-binding protein with TRAM domain|nr:TRAM domain-containing protein [Candidatus Woesearchaeota archaeon]MBT4367817.1 TRAM domain-containing protein [Candidatus Woesearchaeota archaeon]MBT4712305.1 TRAM domain-containing protein [Candidatus Woesearchaeota archaeon]MBT6638853.1 TRAM domain-containing protein [Candidatus Woesearchaeota archaeon]MBT7134497.1 TRAM domain-containing protein [Candidatus Woesearchaeota archaeon]